MSLESSLNFRRVSDTVTTSGIVAADDLAKLKADGYDLVINLLPDSSEYAVAGEAEIIRAQGLAYTYIPIDFASPNREQLDSFVAVMDAHASKKVHIHCAANYRVSAFYSLYALRRGSWSTEQADEHLSSIWQPGQYPIWDEFVAAERARISR